MAQVINLGQYRIGKKKKYIARFEPHLLKFLEEQFRTTFATEMRLIEEYYHGRSWTSSCDKKGDFWQLRDLLYECFSGLYDLKLAQRIPQEWWYHKVWMDREDVIEKSIDLFLESLSSGHAQGKIK